MIAVTVILAGFLAILIAADSAQEAPAVRKRSTGIVGLNILLDGGFPEGTLIMIHGTAVAGVDLAAQQFCNADENEAGSYIRPEEIIEEAGADTKMNPAVILDKMKGSRVVIDSLSAVIDRYGIDQTLFLLQFARDYTRQHKANLMFVVYADVHSHMDMTRIMRMSDVVIEFKTSVQQAEIQRTLIVQKIRGGAVPQRMLPFVITDHGIEASTTSRVV